MISLKELFRRSEWVRLPPDPSDGSRLSIVSALNQVLAADLVRGRRLAVREESAAASVPLQPLRARLYPFAVCADAVRGWDGAMNLTLFPINLISCFAHCALGGMM